MAPAPAPALAGGARGGSAEDAVACSGAGPARLAVASELASRRPALVTSGVSRCCIEDPAVDPPGQDAQRGQALEQRRTDGPRRHFTVTRDDVPGYVAQYNP
jgi:hypothetical protein